MLVHDFVLLFIHVWKWFDLLCTGHGEGFAKQKPTTEVQSVFKTAVNQLYPTRSEVWRPSSSCILLCDGWGEGVRKIADCTLRFPEYR